MFVNNLDCQIFNFTPHRLKCLGPIFDISTVKLIHQIHHLPKLAPSQHYKLYRIGNICKLWVDFMYRYYIQKDLTFQPIQREAVSNIHHYLAYRNGNWRKVLSNMMLKTRFFLQDDEDNQIKETKTAELALWLWNLCNINP